MGHTLTKGGLNAYSLYMTSSKTPHSYWRGHQTFPTVVSLEFRLPEKLQSKSTLSCEIVPIHRLFRHGFIKKPKSKFNRIENKRICFYVTDFAKTDLGIDLIANAFRESIQNTMLFSICSSFIFCFIIYLFEKWKWGLFLLTLKG